MNMLLLLYIIYMPQSFAGQSTQDVKVFSEDQDFNKNLGNSDCSNHAPLRLTDLWTRGNQWQNSKKDNSLPDFIRNMGILSDCKKQNRTDCYNGFSYQHQISEIEGLREAYRKNKDIPSSCKDDLGNIVSLDMPNNSDFKFAKRVLCSEEIAKEELEHEYVFLNSGSGRGGNCLKSYMEVSKNGATYNLFNLKMVDYFSTAIFNKPGSGGNDLANTYIPFATPEELAKFPNIDTSQNFYVLTKNGPFAIPKAQNYNVNDLAGQSNLLKMDAHNHGICLSFHPVSNTPKDKTSDIASSSRNTDAKGTCAATDWGYANYMMGDDISCIGNPFQPLQKVVEKTTPPPAPKTEPTIIKIRVTEPSIGLLNKGCSCHDTPNYKKGVVCYDDEKTNKVYIMSCSGIKDGDTPRTVIPGSNSFDCTKHSISINGGPKQNCCNPQNGYSGEPIGFVCEDLVRNYNKHFDASGKVKDSNGSIKTKDLFGTILYSIH